MKKSGSFHISVKKIDCRYSLETPRRGGSTIYVFEQKYDKIVYPCKPQFYYIKQGLRGSKLYRHIFVMMYRDGPELTA